MSRVIAAFTQFFGDAGDPLENGFLGFYVAGTTSTPKATYADKDLTVANSNPVELDAAGRCPDVFGVGSYRIILYERNPVTGLPGTQIQVFDPVSFGTLLTYWDEAGSAFVPGASGYDLGSTTNLIGDLYQQDSAKHYFGSDQDASIYHDGSNFYLLSDTGQFILGTTDTNDIQIKTNDTVRWRFLSTGHFRPGTANTYTLGTASVPLSNIYIGDGQRLYFGDDQDVSIYHDGSNFYQYNVTGVFILGTTTASGIQFRTDSTTRWAIYANGHLIPATNNSFDIGSSSYRVKTIYAVNALDTSDERYKINVEPCFAGLEFINKLQPKAFVLTEDPDKRKRFGLIAQEVEKVMANFPGIHYDTKEDRYDLDYKQFIPPLIVAIKEQQIQIEELRECLTLH
jgi:hypothetical protein